MASAAQPPQQSDSKYTLANGNVDYDKYIKDYYAWLEKVNAIPDPNRASMFQSKDTAPVRPDPIEPLSQDEIVNAPAADKSDMSDAPGDSVTTDEDYAKGKETPKDDKSKGDRPWWETDADNLDTATGAMMGGEGAPPMPDDWQGEIKNFRIADQQKLNDQYASGVTDTDFRTGVHEARQNRYGEGGYAHGYDYADLDTPDNDLHSAENAKYIGDSSWFGELDAMTPEDQQAWLRAVQAADPESGQVVVDQYRKKKKA
jgi:hypothetical protein